jgi:hypothetical protein
VETRQGYDIARREALRWQENEHCKLHTVPAVVVVKPEEVVVAEVEAVEARVLSTLACP